MTMPAPPGVVAYPLRFAAPVKDATALFPASCAVTVALKGMPAVCGPHLFHLRVRAGAGLLPAFLTWQINQAPLQRQLRSAAEGSSQLSIRIGEIEALKLAVPSMAQQARIVTLAEAAVRERQLLMQLAQNREQELTALANTLALAAGLDTHRTHEPAPDTRNP